MQTKQTDAVALGIYPMGIQGGDKQLEVLVTTKSHIELSFDTSGLLEFNSLFGLNENDPKLAVVRESGSNRDGQVVWPEYLAGRSLWIDRTGLEDTAAINVGGCDQMAAEIAVDRTKNEVRLMSDGIKDAAWQRRLLPLMISMLVVLSLFFCVGIGLEAYRIQKHVEDAHEVDVRPLFTSVGANQAKTFENQMELAEWQTMALLENNALQSRYHEATVALLIRICIVFLGFLTGMVLALIGATFILGKLREPPSNLSAESGAWKVMLGTASPGLVLAVLGAALMLATISARIDVNVTDAALYLSSANAQRAATIRTETAPAGTTPEKREKRSTLLNELPDSKH